MAINKTIYSYNIGPDYSSLYKSSQNVPAESNQSAGGGEDLGETKNKANEQLGMVTNVGNTISNVVDAYGAWNAGPKRGSNLDDTRAEGVNTGDNITASQNKVVATDTTKLEQQEPPTPKIDATATDKQRGDLFNKQINNLTKTNITNEELNKEQPQDFSEVPKNNGSSPVDKMFNVKRDGDKASIKDKLMNFYGEQYRTHNLGDVGLNAWTAQNVALPVLNYAAQYNMLDSKNKWIQAGLTTQRIMQNFQGRDRQTNLFRPTVLDNYYISNFVELADLTTNWNDRNAWQNAMAGAQSAVDMIKNFGWEDAVGGKENLAQMADGLAYLNFGNSIYQLGKNWSNMNAEERTAAMVQTMYAGVQAYNGGSLLINSFAPAAEATTNTAALGAGAVKQAVVQGTENGAPLVEGGAQLTNTGANISTLGGSFMAVVGAYTMSKGIEGLHKAFGQGTNSSMKASTLSGMSTGMGAASLGLGAAALAGAEVGAALGAVGVVVGAAVGAVVGLATGAAKTGASKEKHARDNWRAMYGQVGVFSRAPVAEGSDHHTYAMQLADGRWYDVGHDGSGSRATFINGEVKYIANPDKLTAEDRHRMVNDKHGTVRAVLPYNVDYTNDLDVVGSLMVSGMIVPVGGTYQKERTAEVPQMLGYMTNGITSNCGRELTEKNYKIMADNAKTLYAKIGITNKTQMVNSMGEAYLYGQIDYQDYMSSLTAANLMFDDNGYQQAQAMIGTAQNQPQVPSNN